jgi:glycosyltransferase involved in cell wall biosynthesis
MLFTVDGKLPVTVFENVSTRGGWLNVQEAQAFLTAVDIFLQKNRPDVMVTYGGDPVSIAVQRLAKRRGITIVFELHNFSYSDRTAFEAVDYVTVPAEFSRRFYRERLGLECHLLPNIVNWEAAEVEEGRLKIANCKLKNANLELPSPPSPPAPLPEYRARGDDAPALTLIPPAPLPATMSTMVPGARGELPARRQSKSGDESPHSKLARRYVTFINPHVVKGVYVFARIARELARRRPDIRLLVTQGRSRTDALSDPSLGLAPHLLGQLPTEPARDGRNITLMPFMPDPRQFYPAVYSVTRLLLMPSLWLESFGLVAAEALLNGIPVLASNRGALPDTLGAAGFLFDIPAKYTPETREVPTAEEVEPWVETIIRLWDDAVEYDRWSRAAREHAQQWRPERLAPIYREFFTSVTHQPGPPLVPMDVVAGDTVGRRDQL